MIDVKSAAELDAYFEAVLAGADPARAVNAVREAEAEHTRYIRALVRGEWSDRSEWSGLT